MSSLLHPAAIPNRTDLRRERNRLAQQKRRQRLKAISQTTSHPYNPEAVGQYWDADASLNLAPTEFDFDLSFLEDSNQPANDADTFEPDLIGDVLGETQPLAPISASEQPNLASLPASQAIPVTQSYDDQATAFPAVAATSGSGALPNSSSSTSSSAPARPAASLTKPCQRMPYCRMKDGISPAGRTALHLMSESGSGALISYLIANSKLDVAAKDEYGLTPLHLAARADNVDAARALLDAADAEVEADGGRGKGRLINARDGLGWNALHHAAWCGSEKMVALLVERGAPVEAEIEVRDMQMRVHEKCFGPG